MRSGDYKIRISNRGIRSSLKSYSFSPAALMRTLLQIYHLMRLELKQQAFGFSLGNLWLLLEPALQAGAYYFLLTVVFAMRGSDATFAFFFVAITFWRSHAILIGTSPYFLTQKGFAYIEQGFGLKIAFLEFAAQEVVLFILRFLVLLFFLIVAGYTPSVVWLMSLYFAVCMFLFSLALSLWLSVLGAVFRDIGKFVSHFVWLWWYLSPGLYSIKRIPEWAEPIFALNPFSYIIPAIHGSLLDKAVNPDLLISNTVLALVSLIAMVLGWRMVKRFGYVIARYV